MTLFQSRIRQLMWRLHQARLAATWRWLNFCFTAARLAFNPRARSRLRTVWWEIRRSPARRRACISRLMTGAERKWLRREWIAMNASSRWVVTRGRPLRGRSFTVPVWLNLANVLVTVRALIPKCLSTSPLRLAAWIWPTTSNFCPQFSRMFELCSNIFRKIELGTEMFGTVHHALIMLAGLCHIRDSVFFRPSERVKFLLLSDLFRPIKRRTQSLQHWDWS